MGWFDKLKAIFNFELNSPLINVNVTRNSDNEVKDKEYLIDEKNKRLIINYDKLNDEKKKSLGIVFKDKVEGGGEVLEKNTSMLLDELYNYQKIKGEDKKILDFFSPIIPPEDMEALESSLFVRVKFNGRKDIRKLKEDIRKRFGDRGNNIANLCTAGYFEKFLMPMYNSSRDDFNKVYEVVVSKSVMAIFVYSSMSEAEITNELKVKINLSKKYGLDFIHIHGIGEMNIRIIQNWIRENKDLLEFFDKEIFEKKGIIIVELLL